MINNLFLCRSPVGVDSFTCSQYVAISQASIGIITSTFYEMSNSEEHLKCVNALLRMFLVANAGMKSTRERAESVPGGIKGVSDQILAWLNLPSVVGAPFGTGKSSKKEKVSIELKVCSYCKLYS